MSRIARRSQERINKLFDKCYKPISPMVLWNSTIFDDVANEVNPNDELDSLIRKQHRIWCSECHRLLMRERHAKPDPRAIYNMFNKDCETIRRLCNEKAIKNRLEYFGYQPEIMEVLHHKKAINEGFSLHKSINDICVEILISETEKYHRN